MKAFPWMLAGLCLWIAFFFAVQWKEARDCCDLMQQTLIDLDAERQLAIEGMNNALAGQRAAEARLDSIVARILPVDVTMVRFEIMPTLRSNTNEWHEGDAYWAGPPFEVRQRGRKK